MLDLIALQQKFLALREERDAAKAHASALEAQYREMEATLAEHMKMLGQTSTSLNGKKLTVRVTPRFGRAKEISAEEFCERLTGTRWSFLVKPSVHPQSLQGAMREEIDLNGKLPDEIAPLISTYEQITVAVTKS